MKIRFAEKSDIETLSIYDKHIRVTELESAVSLGRVTSPTDIQKSKIIMDRMKQTVEFRSGSNRPQTLALAETPTLLGEIRQSEKAILDARALYPNSSLADSYNELTMPPELRKAHQNNDRAVMQA